MKNFKKMFTALLVWALVFSNLAYAAGLKRWYAEVVDEAGHPITTGVEFWVRDAGTNTSSSIYNSDDTTDTLTGEVTCDSNGVCSWFSLPATTTFDVQVEYKGVSRSIDGFTNSGRREIIFQNSQALTPLDSGNNIASATTITLPQAPDMFNITGTTTIQTITAAQHTTGRRVTFVFGSALLLGTSGNIVGVSTGNKSVPANAALDFVSDGTNWHVLGIDTSS